AQLREADGERLADVLEVAEQVVGDDDRRPPALRLVGELRRGGALVLSGVAEREAELALRPEADRAQLIGAETWRDRELAGVQKLLGRRGRIVDVAGHPADVDLLLQHLKRSEEHTSELQSPYDLV